MSYVIRAIVGHVDAVHAAVREKRHARVCRLGKAMALVPLSDDLYDELTGSPPGDDPYEALEWLSQGAARWLADASRAAPLAYVEAEYFGGHGEQAAIVFKDGAVAQGPARAPLGPINEALRALGVAAGGAHDEFDAVGLGRHRDVEGWIDDSTVPTAGSRRDA
jgi:hypothetical protein